MPVLKALEGGSLLRFGWLRAFVVAMTFVTGVALQATPVISSSPSCTFGTTYTATANSGVGPLQWALGSNSTAAGAAIDPVTGRIAYSSVGTVVIRVRDNAPTYSSDFTVTVTKATIALSLSNLTVPYDGNSHAALVTPAAIVSTIAGDVNHLSSDDGVGTAGHFANPVGIAVAADGTLYVADNFAIRKISPFAQVTTLAGTPGVSGAVDATGSSARFSSIAGLAVDGSGNLLVADSVNSVIRKVTPGGVVSTFAGLLGAGSGSTNGLVAAARFNIPTGLALSSTGDVYVAEFGGPTIRKISGGSVSTVAGLAANLGGADGPPLTARFESPTSVASASLDRYYVTDQEGTVRRIEADGSVVTVAGAYKQPNSIDGPGTIARFAQPWGIAVDAQDNVFVSDYYTSVIRKISPDGLVTTIAGSANMKGPTDGAGSVGRFANPLGLAVDAQGVLYVADLSNGMIRRVVGAGGTLAVTYNGSTTVPTAAGSYSVVATLTHPNWQGTASGTLTITAVSASSVVPVISSSNATTFGTAYTATVNNSSAGVGAVQWALGTGSTAAGAAINSSTGAVTTTGVGKVVIKARFAGGPSAYSADFTITVGQAGQSAPVISSAASFTLGNAYTATANSGVGALTWALAETGSTATGAAINASTGVVTATSTGMVSIKVRFAGDATHSPSGYSADFVIWVTAPSVNADFNGDDKPDLVLQNFSTGARSIRLMNGATLVMESALSALPKEWSIVTTADFNNDGQPDLLLQNLQTGERKVRLMNGTTAGADVSLGTVPPEWSMMAAADFNGDGHPDILWQHPTGLRHLWFMNGTTRIGDTSLGSVSPEWSISGAADFNGDGRPDILWTHTSGLRYVWFMDGITLIGSASLGNVPVAWSIAMAADFNGDGKPDILWQNTATRQCFLWYMNGVTPIAYADLGLMPSGWSLAGLQLTALPPAINHHDFNGDGKPDILWQHTTGLRHLWFMNGATLIGNTSLGSVPVEWSFAAAADFNGDGQADILLQNLTTGERKIRLMNGSTVASEVSLGIVDPDWSIVAVGDFNSDGQFDILFQHPTGLRHVWFMDGTTRIGDISLGSVPSEWSIAGAADFNGDGQPDILWQHTSGLRHVWFMDGTTVIGDASLGERATEWSIAMVADFNGDGKPDILWQNTTTGQRYLWFMNGITPFDYADLGIVPVEWSIVK